MKTADLSADAFLLAVWRVWIEDDMWASRWAVGERLDGDWPEKIVLAKARRLMKREFIQGCDCGCRGDFELLSAGMDRLLSLGVSRHALKNYSHTRAIPWKAAIPNA